MELLLLPQYQPSLIEGEQNRPSDKLPVMVANMPREPTMIHNQPAMIYNLWEN